MTKHQYVDTLKTNRLLNVFMKYQCKYLFTLVRELCDERMLVLNHDGKSTWAHFLKPNDVILTFTHIMSEHCGEVVASIDKHITVSFKSLRSNYKLDVTIVVIHLRRHLIVHPIQVFQLRL